MALKRYKVRVPRGLEAVETIARVDEVPPARAGLATGDVREIGDALQDLYRSGAYPGVALCLRRHGEIVMHRAYGHARGNGPNDPADSPKSLLRLDTPICLFSASKAVTATLVHQLAEDGAVELDRPVAHYLPAFAQAGKSRTTLADVLSHRGRFPTIELPKPERNVKVLEDWDRIVDLICRAPPTKSTHMAYHAITGGFILAEVIQRVTGRPVSEYLDEKIRRPLGMRHFTYGLAKSDRADAAVNYAAGAKVRFPLSTIAERALIVPFEEVVEASNTATFMDAVIPAGNLYATAEETSRFFQMLLDGGIWRGQRLMKPQTVARLVAPRGRLSFDRTLVIPMRYSEGMMLGINPAGLYGPMTGNAYGHLGFMSILGWADPDRGISCGLLTTGKAILGTHLIALAKLLTSISRRCE
jgi:CubicO group peptidase (beta-lactamase class C family)